MGSAGHAAGIDGHDAAYGAGDLAGRVRAELAEATDQSGVHSAHRRPGSAADTVTAVEDLDAPEVLTGIDEDAVGDGLPTQAGSTREEGHGNPGPTPHRNCGSHLVGVSGGDHHLWGEQVVGGVVSGSEAIGRPQTQ